MEDVEFFRTSKTSKVHVLAGRSNVFPVDETSQASLFAAGMTSRLRALCGAQAPCAQRDYVDAFQDEQLCSRCRKLYPGDPAELFEHEQ